LKHFLKILLIFLASLYVAKEAWSQNVTPLSKAPRSIIFAVFNTAFDDMWVEPIAFVKNGKFVESSAEEDTYKSAPFSDLYYKANSKYKLIFGGAERGTVIIERTNVGSECGGVSADVKVKSTSTKLKGFVMALATNINTKTRKSGRRRSPTATEKSAIEALVRAEYKKHKVPTSSYKQLYYSNLTVLDVNRDGVAEFVGSYWVKPKIGARSHLFFIAEKVNSEKYSLTYREYEAYTADNVMSGDIKDLDSDYGVYQTLLLDVFDYDHDGTAEIFTIGKAFEGNNYFVFKRVRGKWSKVLNTYVYHCGY
jgi:hypothetical protein